MTYRQVHSTRPEAKSRVARWGSTVLIMCLLWVMMTPRADAFLVGLGYQYLRLLETGKVVHHDLRISLDPLHYEAYFTDDLTVQATKNTRELYVTLGVDYALDSVTTVDGEPLAHRVHLRLGSLPFIVYRIDLTERVLKDASTTVRIAYHISPETAQFSFPFLSDRLFFTTIAMLWYPQMPTEGFFSATVHLDGPGSLTMVAEGAPVPGSDGRSWRTVAPVPGFGLAIGNFASQHQEIAGRDVYAWHVEGDPGRSALFATRTAQAIQFFEGLLGPLPLDRLDIVAIPYGLGGSTGQYSWLIYDEMNVEIPLENEVMLSYMAAHEAAHKWLGFTAGLRILGTPWISEGLTDYLAFLAVEGMYGPEALREVIQTRSVQPLADHTGRLRSLASIELIDEDVATAIQKGALVFRTLHRRLGDERFFAFIRTFLKEYDQSHATAREFTTLLEREGGKAVQGFVGDWVNGTQLLDYAVRDVRVSPQGDGERLTFKVVSVGRLVEPGPVEVVVHLADGLDEWLAVEVGKEVSATYDQPVQRITVDPNFWTPDWHRTNNVWEAMERGAH